MSLARLPDLLYYLSLVSGFIAICTALTGSALILVSGLALTLAFIISDISAIRLIACWRGGGTRAFGWPTLAYVGLIWNPGQEII